MLQAADYEKIARIIEAYRPKLICQSVFPKASMKGAMSRFMLS